MATDEPAGRVHRARQPDERARGQPLHRGLAGLRAERCRGRGRSSSCRRTGTSTPPPSPRWRGRGPSTTSTASRDELFAVEYPAPGAPELADEVAEIVKPTLGRADIDSWGLDHGTWSVLVHAFPAADIPVVQLSINADKPFDYHLELGARLAPLRERGVLILGSGNVVHNLGRIDWRRRRRASTGPSASTRTPRRVMTDDPATSPRSTATADFAVAVPTPDHFIPLLYLAGLAGAAGEPRRRARRRLRLRLAVDDLLRPRLQRPHRRPTPRPQGSPRSATTAPPDESTSRPAAASGSMPGAVYSASG